MYNKEIEVRNKLEELSEVKYKEFSEKLIPNCENIIGVRIPSIRKIAKEITKDNPLEYLSEAEDIYFEETMLKGLIIGNLKEDIHIVINQIELFLPKVTNWSLCDSLCCELKITKKHMEEMWDFLEKCINTEKTYYIRFAVVMMLDFYVNEKYLNELFKVFDSIKNEDYYVKMAVAWAISKCFTTYEQETMKYLIKTKIDDETYNKALQKIRESLKVSKEMKEKIKLMKR